MNEMLTATIEDELLAQVLPAEQTGQVMPREARAAGDTPAFRRSRQQIETLLNQLDEREFLILQMRFGLDGEAPRDAAQIGTALAMSEKEVEKMHMAALKRLRTMNLASMVTSSN